MQTYEIIVQNRAIVRNSKDMTLVRTSVGIDRMHVLFDNEEWLDFPISVTFGQGGDLVTIPLQVDRLDDSEWVAEASCVVPHEVIDMVGPIRVTLQGTDSQGRHIITAKGAPLRVEEAGDVIEGVRPSDSTTTDEWQRAYADAVAAVNDARALVTRLEAQLASLVDDAEDELQRKIDAFDGYVLPPATASSLGGVMVGRGLRVAQDGTLSAILAGMTDEQADDLARVVAVVYGTIDSEMDGGELASSTVRPSSLPPATLDALGAIMPDGVSITVDSDGMAHARAAFVETATTASAGVVKPDGTTITVDEDGTIHGTEQTKIATTSTAGKVKPDGTTITVDADGTIHGVAEVEAIPSETIDELTPYDGIIPDGDSGGY